MTRTITTALAVSVLSFAAFAQSSQSSTTTTETRTTETQTEVSKAHPSGPEQTWRGVLVDSNCKVAVSSSTSDVERTSEAGNTTTTTTTTTHRSTGIDPSCNVTKNTQTYGLLLDDGRVFRLDTSPSSDVDLALQRIANKAAGKSKRQHVKVTGTMEDESLRITSIRK